MSDIRVGKTVSLIRPMADLAEKLTTQERVALYCSMLAQEVCALPASERWEALDGIMNVVRQWQARLDLPPGAYAARVREWGTP